MRAHLIATTARTTSHSPSWHTWCMRHAVMVTGLVALFGTSATGALAHRAQPEDVLYPFKVYVNDRVAVVLAGGREGRLEKKLEQLDRMMHAEEVVAMRVFTNAEDIVEDEADKDGYEEDGSADRMKEAAAMDASLERTRVPKQGPGVYDDGLFEDALEALERELQELEREAVGELRE